MYNFSFDLSYLSNQIKNKKNVLQLLYLLCFEDTGLKQTNQHYFGI
jgi:hypothetical protein